MYADAHTHLAGSPFGENVFTDEEVKKIVQQAKDAGVVLILVGSHDLPSGRRVRDIAEKEEEVYASIGIHPWIAAPIDDQMYREFLDLAKHPKVVAIGEIGLDAVRSRADREVQLACLSRLLRLARETGLPPIIHQRGLHRELIETIHGEKPPAGAIHGFSGEVDELDEWLDMGYYITVGRAVLAEGGENLQGVVTRIPAERLLLETDGANRTKEGALEGQERVVRIAEVAGAWRGTTGAEIGNISTRNLKRMLAL